MAKNLKINIKNTQIAEALNLNKIKKKLASNEKKIKKTTKQKKEAEEKDIEKKPKARLLPSVEKKEEKPKKVTKKKVKEVAEKQPKEKSTKKKTVVTKEKKPSSTKEKATSSPAADVAKEKEQTKKEPIKPLPIDKPSPVTKEKEEQQQEEVVSKKPLEKTFEEEKKETGKSLKKEKDFRSRRFESKAFDARARQGLRADEEERWRKFRKPHHKQKNLAREEQEPIRPSHLKVKIPISIKDLASDMKLKASQLISKLFMQGLVVTLNDLLDDETTIQLLGQEFNCDITIDTSEETRLKITNETVEEEIKETAPELLQPRPAIITFMGHVDHGKTSLIDAIRQSNITASEAGAITQHIGAFSVKTSTGEMITILDTPGHEAFTEMRSRGALVTDLVVLVIAGDEGIREQTIEALNQAKEAKVPILVAINKVDKANFDAEKVYRQLTDHELLPEAWGGSVITVNCSAVTKEGMNDLLEMIALQSEILELKANPSCRARGVILESQMHKGLGAIATILVQNGTLKLQDPVVFGCSCGKIKTMHDEYGNALTEATPSTAVKITGLSDLAEAGDEFIVVANEKEAKKIAHDRKEVFKKRWLQQMKKGSIESLREQTEKKVLHVILRADVQGSLEALEASLNKIHSKKINLNIISSEVGEISESDIQLAAASKAVIIGFHTAVESHAEELIKQLDAKVYLYDIIYHAIDAVKNLMVKELDKIAQENELGKAKVKAIYKSSQVGTIAGCEVIEGMIKRSYFIRVTRKSEILWKGKINSLKRVKEDVKEVQKGIECGIVLDGFSQFAIDDILEAYDITYLEQTL